MLIVFCVERPSEEGAPFGWGIELCRCSSCVLGLRSFLNTKGILTLSMFLLSDGSLIQMWSASFVQQCRVLLSLSIIVIFAFDLEEQLYSLEQYIGCIWRLQIQPMYCSRDYNCSSRFNQQYEKSTPNFAFDVFSGDMVVSDGTGALISMVWNLLFQGPVGFTYVFSCAVVGWAFLVVDYISFLRILNWIFSMHE